MSIGKIGHFEIGKTTHAWQCAQTPKTLAFSRTKPKIYLVRIEYPTEAPSALHRCVRTPSEWMMCKFIARFSSRGSAKASPGVLKGVHQGPWFNPPWTFSLIHRRMVSITKRCVKSVSRD